jgi:hypothetical protein
MTRVTAVRKPRRDRSGLIRLIRAAEAIAARVPSRRPDDDETPPPRRYATCADMVRPYRGRTRVTSVRR